MYPHQFLIQSHHVTLDILGGLCEGLSVLSFQCDGYRSIDSLIIYLLVSYKGIREDIRVMLLVFFQQFIRSLYRDSVHDYLRIQFVWKNRRISGSEPWRSRTDE